MKFTYPHMTQTDLGKMFGVTSHKIGQWLNPVYSPYRRIELENIG